MLEGRLRWQNDRNAILYDTSFCSMVKRVLFHPLSSSFLKENQFSGGSRVGGFGVFFPKVHWGLKNMWKKFREFLKKFGDFWRNFVSLLFQICFFQSKRFQISPLDGSPQHMFHVILCWYHLWQRLKYFVKKGLIFLSILMVLNSIDTLFNVFQRGISLKEACFFNFMILGS